MVRLRHPRADLSQIVQVPVTERRRNELAAGEVCDGCRWPDRCQTDRLCWAAEKQDIAAERLEPRPRLWHEWDRESTLEAFHAWVASHGQIPIRESWERSAADHPGINRVDTLFGGWNNLIEAAGYKPRLPYGRDPNTYP